MLYVGTARWGVTQSVAFTATPGAIPNPGTTGVIKLRLMVTSDAFVTTDGTTPSATNGTYMVAFQPEYVTISYGQLAKAVQVTAAGTLYSTECN